MRQPDDIAQELLLDREKGAARFMAEYRERLYSVALALCRDETEAEDLVLRTLERVIEKIGTYQERNSFFNWTCVIMLNLYRDLTRGKVAQGTRPVGGASEMDALMEPTGAERIVTEVDSGIVRQVLEGMPEEMREVLLLHYFMDMPVGKIAKFLAMPVGTIKSRLYYARVALGRRLGVKLKQPAVALIAAALFLIAGAATVVVGRHLAGASNLAGGDEPMAQKGTETADAPEATSSVPLADLHAVHSVSSTATPSSGNQSQTQQGETEMDIKQKAKVALASAAVATSLAPPVSAGVSSATSAPMASFSSFATYGAPAASALADGFHSFVSQTIGTDTLPRFNSSEPRGMRIIFR